MENMSNMSLSNLPKSVNQTRTKKLGAIMGIAKRSRSIHYTECPSNSKFCQSSSLLIFYQHSYNTVSHKTALLNLFNTLRYI